MAGGDHAREHLEVLGEERRRVLFEQRGRLPQTDGDDLREVALRLEEPELELYDAPDLFFYGPVRGRGPLEDLEQLPDAILEDADQDRVLVLEVQVDGAVGDIGGVRDLADARRVEAVLGEDLRRRLEDALALLLRSAHRTRLAHGRPLPIAEPPFTQAVLARRETPSKHSWRTDPSSKRRINGARGALASGRRRVARGR